MKFFEQSNLEKSPSPTGASTKGCRNMVGITTVTVRFRGEREREREREKEKER